MNATIIINGKDATAKFNEKTAPVLVNALKTANPDSQAWVNLLTGLPSAMLDAFRAMPADKVILVKIDDKEVAQTSVGKFVKKMTIASTVAEWQSEIVKQAGETSAKVTRENDIDGLLDLASE